MENRKADAGMVRWSLLNALTVVKSPKTRYQDASNAAAQRNMFVCHREGIRRYKSPRSLHGGVEVESTTISDACLKAELIVAVLIQKAVKVEVL